MSARASQMEQLEGQQQLFAPPPPPAPTFDEMCPPIPSDEQLELEIGAAIAAGAQTHIYGYER